MRIVVLAKQVPDTRNVGKDAMKEDGTVNRAILPAIFNPEDLNALEMALGIKEQFPGTTIQVLTMGPPRAAELIREALYRGADGGILLSDKAFAGADTLATSYALSKAIQKMGQVDLIIGGRQAIDGDTAQVGPQVAEKLNLYQVTYAEEILELDPKNKQVRIKRRLPRGIEVVLSPMPVLITVNGSAKACRPRNAKRVLKYKYALTRFETEENPKFKALCDQRSYLNIPVWDVDFIEADKDLCGLSGSPTKVKKIESVVFQAKENMTLESTDAEIETLIKTLLENHTIG
ncbi:MAG: electron transfer flavoprotein subunit beta/FixA family protein [Bacteroidales bacterium]|mgnify:CR=1 FL=1|jgi:electron transfer flavoprotein beta subunit|nr:electron transfer flavoprotein subunit beta/FixA family protein [Bacteroidales bacterium]OQC03585.1 MAG: Acryloyl-CoA reductase electron transfer subunit gamma [Bacteroidetes bacterium ADurb.Bin090]MBP8981567.1 electron transfer flavoprotein subunit beta/FixA family protein [Bacteroidales bacterium]NLV37982.1 electron transfer flavoprotein subunit beta/FixA family protein [Bacteroidales bacterium]HNZ80587.1 electron transfer flavoprotein subunit beta/FixA family protein [Bacteroidales bacter